MVAKVTGGEVQGQRVGQFTSYKGIPFAAPPVGPLRWKPPQPVAPWKEPRQATEYGPACIQFAPPAVTEAAGFCMMDWLGTAIRGSTEPLADAIAAVIKASGGEPQAIGRTERRDARLRRLRLRLRA